SFVFIGFLIAYWLFCAEHPVADKWTNPVNLLLLFQLAGGLFSWWQDIRRPFSYSYLVTDLLREVPAGDKWVTDYWTMNTVVAYTDHPAYCVDMGKPLSFILWSKDMSEMDKKPYRY